MDVRVLQTISYLKDNATAGVTVGELAERVHLTESRLQHLFKADVALPIREFIRRQRLRRAAELIATTDERISQICFLAGFSDVSNFNHAFKREFDLCPRDFRKMCRSLRANRSAVEVSRVELRTGGHDFVV